MQHLGSVTGQWLELRAADGYRYQLTDDDVLWAARMIMFEGGATEAPAVLWTMAQLFSPAGQREKYGRTRFTSFAELLRAYSQPINPRWASTGEFCRTGGSRAGTEHCSASRLERRRQAQTIPYDRIPRSYRAVVEAFAKGRLPNPVPRAVEFAAPSVAASFVRGHPGSRVAYRWGNHFITTAGSARWPADYVTIGGMGAMYIPWVPMIVGLSAGGALVALYIVVSAIYRRRARQREGGAGRREAA